MTSKRRVENSETKTELPPHQLPWHPARLCSYLNTETGNQVCVVQGNGLWPSLWDKQKWGKLEKIRKRGKLEAKVKETRHAAVPPPTFLALGVGHCVLFKGPLASLAWASASRGNGPGRGRSHQVSVPPWFCRVLGLVPVQGEAKALLLRDIQHQVHILTICRHVEPGQGCGGTP